MPMGTVHWKLSAADVVLALAADSKALVVILQSAAVQK